MPGTRHALLPRRYPYFGPDPTTTPDEDQRCFSFPTPLAPGPACTPDFVCPRYYGGCDAPVPPNTLPRVGRLSPSLRWTRTCHMSRSPLPFATCRHVCPPCFDSLATPCGLELGPAAQFSGRLALVMFHTVAKAPIYPPLTWLRIRRIVVADGVFWAPPRGACLVRVGTHDWHALGLDVSLQLPPRVRGAIDGP